MLRKLFKYDFLAIGKTMWLFTILAVVAGIIASCIGIFMNKFFLTIMIFVALCGDR